MDSFGRYELLRRIGVGGMAEIHLAHSRSIDGFEKLLVIKKMRPDLSTDEQFFSMFINEARLTIGFSHPNIVQVFDFGKAEGSYYLAMEYVNGCDLGTLLQLRSVSGKGLPIGLALWIANEVCKGLDYAHAQVGRSGEPLNVVHKDISPQNVLLSSDGAAKVGDFGIAEARGSVTKTDDGMVIGKVGYMSPEHATGQPVDRRADIFSVGIVLWESLCGKNAYGTSGAEDYFERIRRAIIEAPSKHRPDISLEVDELLRKALSFDPNDRYQSSREFSQALHRTLVANFPEVSSFSLQAFLADHAAEIREIHEDDVSDELSDEEAELLLEQHRVARTGTNVLIKTDGFDWTPGFIEAVESFKGNPSLWTLVKMGDLCRADGHTEEALACYRLAAVKFAQGGLLAPCLYVCKHMLDLQPFEVLKREFTMWPWFEGRPTSELRKHMFKSQGPVPDLLRELIADVPDEVKGRRHAEGTPLLSRLGGHGFAEFARSARLRRFKAGENLVKQGDPGETMFIIARGRVLIYAERSDGKKVYLSSLMAGDFLGENSFFTRAPRSATVEILYDVAAFEIDQTLYERVMEGNQEASGVLLQFYKDRIVETVMATSPTFGLLANADRRALVERFELRTFEPGEIIIQEGEKSEQIYLIKNGAAEVFTEKGGPRTVLSEIGPGAIFGEVAALRAIARTASVSAKTRVEALELGGGRFAEIVNAQPDLKERIMNVVAQRARENMDKVMGPSPFAKHLT